MNTQPTKIDLYSGTYVTIDSTQNRSELNLYDCSKWLCSIDFHNDEKSTLIEGLKNLIAHLEENQVMNIPTEIEKHKSKMCSIISQYQFEFIEQHTFRKRYF